MLSRREAKIHSLIVYFQSEQMTKKDKTPSPPQQQIKVHMLERMMTKPPQSSKPFDPC
jgi:hypothetical protein